MKKRLTEVLAGGDKVAVATAAEAEALLQRAIGILVVGIIEGRSVREKILAMA